MVRKIEKLLETDVERNGSEIDVGVSAISSVGITIFCRTWQLNAIHLPGS